MDDPDLKRKMNLMEQRLLQKARELSLLKEMSLFLTDSVQKTLDLLAYRIGVLTNAKFVRVYLVDKSSTKLIFVSGYNLSEKYLEMVKDRFEVSIDSVPSGKAVKEKSPYVVSDVMSDDAFSSWSSIAALHGYASYIAFPLMVHDRIVGAADVFFEHVKFFSDDEINLMTVLCNTGALAIENAMLIEKIANISIMDEDTGAFNDRHFKETLKREVERAKRYGQPLSLIGLRIGTPASGEEAAQPPPFERLQAMRSFVAVAKNKTRGSDLLFRCGDNLFCLILTQTPKQAASEVVVARLLYAFHEIFGKETDVKVGISGIPEDGETAESVLKKAIE